MSEVKRWNVESDEHSLWNVESAEGEFVTYGDYAALKADRDALAAENAMLKSGIGFFSYGTDSGFEEHDSAEKAIAAADSDIDYYRGDACDGWSEETDQTVWGVILQRATMIDEQPRSEELPYGSCDFALLPNLATSATDAYANQLRAEGVEMFAKYISLYNSNAKSHADEFAANLRKENGND